MVFQHKKGTCISTSSLLLRSVFTAVSLSLLQEAIPRADYDKLMALHQEEIELLQDEYESVEHSEKF